MYNKDIQWRVQERLKWVSHEHGILIMNVIEGVEIDGKQPWGKGLEANAIKLKMEFRIQTW